MYGRVTVAGFRFLRNGEGDGVGLCRLSLFLAGTGVETRRTVG